MEDLIILRGDDGERREAEERGASQAGESEDASGGQAWRGGVARGFPDAASQGRHKGAHQSKRHPFLLSVTRHLDPPNTVDYLVADTFQAGVTTGLLPLRIEHPSFELQTPRIDAVWTCWTEAQGTRVGREADEHRVESAAGDDDHRVIDRATTMIKNE